MSRGLAPVERDHARPPFTLKVCLVIMWLSSAARNSARRAMSAGMMVSGRNWLFTTAATFSSVGYHSPLLLLRQHQPGGDGIDADAVLADLARQRMGEADHGGLGRGVAHQLGHADLPGDRRHIDDRSAAPLDHLRNDGLGGEKDVTEIDRHRLVELPS